MSEKDKIPWNDVLNQDVVSELGRLIQRHRAGEDGATESLESEASPPESSSDLAKLNQLVALLSTELSRQSMPSPVRRSGGAPKTRYRYDEIIGQSPRMQELYQLLDKVIDSDSTVLVQGENGTGKELIARAIHFNSSRKGKRFVVQNCSAFNDNLLDSELFGHKKGAFTGAISDKQGLFEVADGSTFFLDEIGDMSPSLQVKLLRVLQEGTFIPVGDTRPKCVHVRIIAATNRDLKQMVSTGQFREDLYYRINVINISVPPLRDRRDDILPLAQHFLAARAEGGEDQARELTRGCVDRLMEYNWPGNVRELENEIERLVVLTVDHLPISEDLLSTRIGRPMAPDGPLAAARSTCLPEAIMELERRMIRDVLGRHGWNKTRAAQELSISRRNLIRKVSKYKLEPPHNG